MASKRVLARVISPVGPDFNSSGRPVAAGNRYWIEPGALDQDDGWIQVYSQGGDPVLRMPARALTYAQAE